MVHIRTTACFSLIAAVALACACSASPPGERGPKVEVSGRCHDLCMSEFTACTQKSAGSYGACDRQLRGCKTECEAQEAERRAEEREGEVVAPDGLEAGPDAGASEDIGSSIRSGTDVSG